MQLVIACAIGVCVWVFYGSGYGCLAKGMGVQ